MTAYNEYVILSHNDHSILTEVVMKRMKAGWYLYGEISTCAKPNGYVWYTQVMVKQMEFPNIPTADFYDILLFKYYGIDVTNRDSGYFVTMYTWGDKYCVTDHGRIK